MTESPGVRTELPDGGSLFTATAKEAVRLDVFLAALCGETRSFVQRAVEEGCAAVNGKACRAGTKLRPGDCVELRLEKPREPSVEPEDIPLPIVYEDADIAVVDKPRGMVVHPAPGNAAGTLVNAALYAIRDLSGIGGELRPGIVHRIDKMTSGLVVIAKNDFAHRALSAQLKEHEAGRVYLAIVDGNIREDSGTVDAPVGRHPTERKRMAVVSGGRRAVTHWRVLERMGSYALVAARLETGRTHQIRVHMAHIKHPVAGDAVYGNAKDPLGIGGQALHAVRLTLTHPRTGETMTFRAPVPAYFMKALAKAGHDAALDVDALIDGIKKQ
ncbi:MAG TPA: RluA family pseudouridine synthase [Clostridia bacterium]|nr:RluA family pseudouridine synthase [Clostridia bacterium]